MPFQYGEKVQGFSIRISRFEGFGRRPILREHWQPGDCSDIACHDR
jgi:hypothetical protein